MRYVQIALDGPSGAGKSTLARRLAQHLGYIYVDTGAMYRAVALKALRLGLDVRCEAAVAPLRDNTAITLRAGQAGQAVLLDGEDVSAAIRTEAVSMAASHVSAHGSIRTWMLTLQRALAARANVVMDGRDIGTRVLPDATYKFYITATAAERGRRRYLELRQKGADVTLQQVIDDVQRRDAQDMNRAIDPLRPADDATVVDTTAMDADAVLQYLCKEMGYDC